MRYHLKMAAVMSSVVFTACQAEPLLRSVPSDPLKPIIGAHHYIEGYAPLMGENIQVVIEIPTGTTAKWEVDKSDGKLRWEMKEGKPRIVQYLGYPGNYGMIPRTLLPKELGGDGDPLDVIVLGPPAERGTVVQAKLIGVLKLLDGGEQDDKLVAVLKETPFYDINSITELDQNFAGVTKIIRIWFESYKGPGEMQALGFADKDEANAILQAGIAAYQADAP